MKRFFTYQYMPKTSVSLFILCLFLFTGCHNVSSSPIRATGFYFDTIITVTLYDSSKEPLLNQCMELAGYYENLLSPNIPGSDIWNINHSNGLPVTVDADTLSLLEDALLYAQLSDGLTDPTIGTLSALWNFGSDNKEIIPSPTQIEEAISHVDYHSVLIDGSQVTLTDPDAQIDLGFIAKGFIGDKIKEFLLTENVSSAIINLGGNIVAVGNKPEGSPFQIGIRDPFNDSGAPLLTLDLSDKSVVSSGNYERFFIKDGKRYHHILSPKTGYPADSGIAQTTIISSSSTDGDALSTLCYILGYEKAVSMLKNFPDVWAVFVTEDGHIRYVNFN